MYYPAQSPNVSHKLHHADQNTWSRFGVPQGGGGGESTVGPPPPPTSPGYAHTLYTNPAAVSHLPGHHPLSQHPLHHHQNSLSHFTSPQNGHAHAVVNPSPGLQQTELFSPHWQQQLLKCEMVRASRSPHHRARASAMASRTVAKSAIPITNPNAIPVVKPASASDAASANGSTTNGKDGAAANGAGAPELPQTPAMSAAQAVMSPGTPSAAQHPSGGVAPVSTPGPSSQTTNAGAAKRTPVNNSAVWSSLDMGGVHIKHLPPTSGVFSYTFLTTLYLNHNQLSSIPGAIGKLRHLELLDLSGNQLATLPPEIGMLTSLRELYLFDNAISVLPHELGSLYQLQTLGVEGNPLDVQQMKLVQKDGTSALIAFLRDSCPPPAPPPQRKWVDLISPAEREAIASDPTVETFSVLSYNTLWEKAATERMYGYTPQWALAWDYRKELILTEVMNYNADFLCLQEVDITQYEDYFVPALEGVDYEGVYWPRSRFKTMSDADRRVVDGCATFFKKSKYNLVEKQLIEFSAVAMQRADFKKTDDMFNRVLGKDHIAVVCLLEHRESGSRLILANTHILWDPQFRDVKLVQTALLMDELERIAHSFARLPPRLAQPGQRPAPTYADGTKIPVVLAIDSNSAVDSGVYEFLSTGTVPPDHEDFMGHTYGRYTSDGLRHRLGLKSSYAAIGELPMTNHTASFRGTIDYIFYSGQTLAVNAVLGEVDKSYLEKVVGFPNAHFPSDHICILSEFRVKPPRDTAPTRAS